MGEKKLHYKMYKDGKKFVFAAIATLSFFVFGGVSTVAVHADTTSVNLTAATVNSTSDTKSAVSSAATVASSSSATKANSTSASSSSAVKTETTSASSSSAVKTETTSASSSSATKADSTSASSSSAVKTETTSASSSSATKADSANATITNEHSASASNLSKTGAASTSTSTEVKTNAKYANSVETVDNNKRGNRENTHSINQSRIVKRSLVDPSAGKITINRDNFKDFFNQNGSAKDNYDQLTGIQTITNGSFQSGNISFDGSIDVRHNFEIDGAINLGQITSRYGYTGIADGIGFVFYKGERNQVGGNGGDLGIYGVTNAFGWKVDTWLNDSHHTNSGQNLKGDYDDGHQNPYGAFITTNKTGYGSIDRQSAKNLTRSIEDNKFHDVKFIYTANTKEFKIVLSTPDGDVPFSKTFDYDETSPAYYFTIAASTGILPTHQAFRIDSMTYSPIQKAIINYVDDTTGRTIASDSVTGNSEETIDYSTANKISGFQKNGYELVKDGFSKGATYDNNDTTDQNFTVHLKHQLTPVNPTDPQTPGAPINPDEPDGPKWPEGTDKSSVTQTVIRTVNYLDKQTGKVVAKQVTEQVTYNRTAIVDKVTGQIIGYSTTGGDTVDQTDGDKAWTAVDNKSDWDSVTSPDLSSKGYLAPDLATVAQQTVTPGDKDVTVNVYYDHDVVPVNPTNPQTPGTPINPDDPDSPKWPAGTDKNSLTTDVHQTIHYQYGDGSQAAPDKTDSTTFDHQVEIDKVTGEIVKDDGWTAENGKTSFDSKNSPVIPGYTASKPASDPVDGLTQDSKDNVQTIVYAKTPVAGGNVTAKYVDENGNPIADDVIASGNVGDPYSTTQKDVPGYTFKEVQGNPTGSFTDQDQTVTYVYTKNPATDNNGGTGPNQPGKPGNGTDTGNPSSNQPGNPSQPSNATNNGVINTSTNTGSKVNNGAVNSPELPQTGENNSQSQTMSFIGILLAMFGSLLGFLGIKKRRND
ncbi:inlJ [Limosilactobacillus fermentum 3872]|uniref:Gram-positive cocci surface proteins LPxTG domain-containing protein n=1 Tax=Limosilactobacillus fermentum 3872 TaxID=1381124 RepID=A0A806TMJ4_LIMFE|nr:MucBP domain-containing protein [Limosilactobacillus fermentum]AKM52152.1 inlJ [Limosilactobacillus fermentum 3872]